MAYYFFGRGYDAFLFQTKEHIDLIFKSRSYFTGTKGMYLNRWTPDLNLENYMPYAILFWV
jgi:hypothetical protein